MAGVARAKMLAAAALLLAAMAALPLAGVALAGKRLGDYLRFPPRAGFVRPAPFSWPAFVGLALVAAVGLAPIARRLLARLPVPPERTRSARPYPWWGWAGIGSARRPVA